MIRASSLSLVTGVAVLGLAAAATAQRGQRADFGPEVGSPVPDVSGFDADGRALSLTSLKGKHAVIVFGCLT